MAASVVYNKAGKAFKVTHAIDVQGWLEKGYTKTDPKAEAKAKAAAAAEAKK